MLANGLIFPIDLLVLTDSVLDPTRPSLLNLQTDVCFELPPGDATPEHLVDLLQTPPVDVGEHEVDKDRGDEATHEPYPGILGTPVELRWIDEVGGGEGAQPGEDKADSDRQSLCVGAELLGRQLAGGQEGVRLHPQIEAEQVETAGHDHANTSLVGGEAGDGVHDGDDDH